MILLKIKFKNKVITCHAHDHFSSLTMDINVLEKKKKRDINETEGLICHFQYLISNSTKLKLQEICLKLIQSG
jgi:hypothetical protein